MILHAVEDVQFLRTFGAPFHLSVRYRPEDATAGAVAVEPDFSSLRGKGRPGSRDLLISALSAGVQSLSAPGDHAEAFALTEDIDGGLLLRTDLRTSAGQTAWANLCDDEIGRRLEGAHGPGRRLMGSAAAGDVRAALLRGVPEAQGELLHVPTPILWLPPGAGHWGRSVAFANLARELSAGDQDGTVLLARSDGTPRGDRSWLRTFGPREGQPALFDRCLAVRPNLPSSLEVVVKPGAWALVLVHVPEARGGFPIPFGYMTGATALVAAWRHVLAEVAGAAAGSHAVLWHDAEETPADALAAIDLGLGIGEA